LSFLCGIANFAVRRGWVKTVLRLDLQGAVIV
jgi:hypothetical protein